MEKGVEERVAQTEEVLRLASIRTNTVVIYKNHQNSYCHRPHHSAHQIGVVVKAVVGHCRGEKSASCLVTSLSVSNLVTGKDISLLGDRSRARG